MHPTEIYELDLSTFPPKFRRIYAEAQHYLRKHFMTLAEDIQIKNSTAYLIAGIGYSQVPEEKAAFQSALSGAFGEEMAEQILAQFGRYQRAEQNFKGNRATPLTTPEGIINDRQMAPILAQLRARLDREKVPGFIDTAKPAASKAAANPSR